MSNQTNVESIYVIPLWREIMWSLLFAIIPIVGATGNFIVIWIVMTHKNMRTATNLFIVNLAVADGLMSTINAPVVAYEIIYSDWQFGWLYCKLNEGLASMNICVSILMFSMISIDRYFAIMYPFRRRIKKQTTIWIITLVWCTSFVVTCPNWIYVTVGSRTDTPGGKIKYWCGQVWPDHDIALNYRIGFIITTYFLPLLCLTYTYSVMGTMLWGSKRIGENSLNHQKNIKSKRKIVKMMIIIVVTFALCWLPFQLLFLLILTGVLRNSPEYIQEIYLITFWFAMSNSMYNPIIYCWMSAKFRTGFKRALKCCPFISHYSGRYQISFSDTKKSSSEF